MAKKSLFFVKKKIGDGFFMIKWRKCDI